MTYTGPAIHTIVIPKRTCRQQTSSPSLYCLEVQNTEQLHCMKIIADLRWGVFKAPLDSPCIFEIHIKAMKDIRSEKDFETITLLWPQPFCQFWHVCTNDVKRDEKHWEDLKS